MSNDAGGVSREFFTVLMQDLLSENLGLFSTANTTEFSYKLNEDSRFIENYERYFLFFGKVIAKALFDHIPLNICLNRSIFKTLLGEV
jgi:E3 ubiquitin-protein ligase HUWE1